MVTPYRKMEQPPPEKPPRQEWAFARLLRQCAAKDEGWGPIVLLLVLMFLLLSFNRLMSFVVPMSRNDVQATVPADVRCIRSHGRWSSGRIQGHYAGWCTWGPR